MFGLFGKPSRDDLETRVAKLETTVTTLQLEWSETLDKLLHRLQRQSKRDRDAIATATEAPGSPNGGGAGVAVPPTPHDAKRALWMRARGIHAGR